MTSCVNEEVWAFNRKLNKIAKRFGNASIVNVESQRHLFTRHGSHMNTKGKKVMAKRLAAVIPVIIDSRKTSDPIFLTSENKLTRNLGFQHDEGAAQKRNGMDNLSSNSEDVREEDELDICVCVCVYIYIYIYCNEFAGSISRWNFIALQKSLHYS
jgi:hypothetical protein